MRNLLLITLVLLSGCGGDKKPIVPDGAKAINLVIENVTVTGEAIPESLSTELSRIETSVKLSGH